MNRIPVLWQTSDSLLNDNLQRGISNVEKSDYGLYVFGTHKWLIDVNEHVEGIVYQHVRRSLRVEDLDIEMLCGFKVRAYGITDIFPLNEAPHYDDKKLCSKCAVSAEFIIWSA